MILKVVEIMLKVVLFKYAKYWENLISFCIWYYTSLKYVQSCLNE